MSHLEELRNIDHILACTSCLENRQDGNKLEAPELALEHSEFRYISTRILQKTIYTIYRCLGQTRIGFVVLGIGVCTIPKTTTAETQHKCPDEALFVFQSGDTLSDVLCAVTVSELYGSKGRVAKTIIKNKGKFMTGKPGRVRALTSIKIEIEKCPDPKFWRIENGVLLRHKNLDKPFKEQDFGDSSPQKNQKYSHNPTEELPSPETPASTNSAKTARLPVISIIETKNPQLPAPKIIEGEITEETLNDLINN